MPSLLAFGWGAGHDTVARAVASRLPPPWPERLQGETRRQFCADNHDPDSFEPFAVAPYFWTQETPSLAPPRLELDQAGTELVKAALDKYKVE